MEILSEILKYQHYDLRNVVATTNNYFETNGKDYMENTNGTILKSTVTRQVFTVCDDIHYK